MKKQIEKQKLIASYEAKLRKTAAQQNWRPSELAMSLADAPRMVAKILRQVAGKNTIKIKPCPFCASGEAGCSEFKVRGGGNLFQGECQNCGAEGPCAETCKKALALWNKRPTAASAPPQSPPTR